MVRHTMESCVPAPGTAAAYARAKAALVGPPFAGAPQTVHQPAPGIGVLAVGRWDVHPQLPARCRFPAITNFMARKCHFPSLQLHLHRLLMEQR